MGTWGNDPFGNDTACDWALELEEVDDLSLIEEAIQRVLDVGNESLEAGVSDAAIAAADTLARLKGNFYAENSYTEAVDQWVTDHPIHPPAALVGAAIRAVDRILTAPSELLELWEASPEVENWKQQMTALKERLK